MCTIYLSMLLLWNLFLWVILTGDRYCYGCHFQQTTPWCGCHSCGCAGELIFQSIIVPRNIVLRVRLVAVVSSASGTITIDMRYQISPVVSGVQLNTDDVHHRESTGVGHYTIPPIIYISSRQRTRKANCRKRMGQ